MERSVNRREGAPSDRADRERTHAGESGSAPRVRWPLCLLIVGALASGCASVSGPDAPAGGTLAQREARGEVATSARAPTVAAAPAAPAPTTTTPLAPETRPVPASRPPSAVDPIASAMPPAAAPVMAAAEPSGDLWDRIRAGFAMPDLPSPLVAEKERFYLSKPDYLQRMFQRGGRYLFHIVEELEKRGMPTELALLPFVESAMNPVALSPAQAAGLWQFIPSTGRAYDLQQNWWVDNRRDVVKSTQAALDYLQKIYAMHGNDWFLALASYNWGEGSVAKAVRRNQALGKPTDYLNLSMPNETRHYVPKLIALKNILLNAPSLGVALPALPNRPYFVTIEKTRPIDLQLAARFARMSVDEFVALNPAHNRPVISATRNNAIRLPADRLEHFKSAMAAHEAERQVFASWQPYTLKSGETLDTLAQRAGVTVAELRRANGLRDGGRIVAGTRLLAPQKSVADESNVETFVAPRVYEQIDRPAQYHTVGKRESLASIASRYQVSTATLAAWNGLRRSVARGMRLLVHPASTQTLLTTENGERSVVSQAKLVTVAATDRTIDPPAAAPVAAPTKEAEAPRAVKAVMMPARPAPSTRAARTVASAKQADRRVPAAALAASRRAEGRAASRAGASRAVAPASQKVVNAGRGPAARATTRDLRPAAPRANADRRVRKA